MFEMSLTETIESIVDNFLPVCSPKDEGLMISAHVSICEPYAMYTTRGDDYPRTIGAYVHFLFRRATNYTNVWFAVCDDYFDKPDWINTSNHDSCWRTDGVRSRLNTLYFKMCKIVNSEVAPIKLETSVSNLITKKVKIINFHLDSDNPAYSGRYVFDEIVIEKVKKD